MSKDRFQKDPWEWRVASGLGDHEPKSLRGPGGKTVTFKQCGLWKKGHLTEVQLLCARQSPKHQPLCGGRVGKAQSLLCMK